MLISTHIVDMIVQVLSGLVIDDRDEVGEERMHDRSAADVAKAGAGRWEVDQRSNSFTHFADLAWVAVRSVDVLHHDISNLRARGRLPCESMVDPGDFQATSWSAVESLGRPVLR